MSEKLNRIQEISENTSSNVASSAMSPPNFSEGLLDHPSKDDPQEGKLSGKRLLTSYIFALLAAVFYSLGNFLMAFMSDISTKEIYPQWMSSLLLWMIYHVYAYCKSSRSPEVKAQGSRSFFSKKHSIYWKELQEDDDSEVFYKLKYSSFQGPFLMTLINIFIQVFISLTFSFGTKGNINSGILSTIFSSSVIFTALLFYIFYRQRLTQADWIGSFCIIAGVVLIGYGGADSSGEESETDVKDVVFAIACGLGAGFAFSTNTLAIQYSVSKLNFDPWQLVFDGNVLYALILIPIFFYYQYTEHVFTLKYILLANLQQFFLVFGTITFSLGLRYGQGASVQAIEEFKSVIQTIWSIIFLNQLPNLVEYCGMAMGLLGVLIIICLKKEEKK